MSHRKVIAVCWGPRASVCSQVCFKIQPQGAADRYTWKSKLLANTPYLSHLVTLSLQTPSSVSALLSWQCPTTQGNSFPPAPHRHRRTEHSRQAWGCISINKHKSTARNGQGSAVSSCLHSRSCSPKQQQSIFSGPRLQSSAPALHARG